MLIRVITPIGTMTTGEAAKILGVPRPTIIGWCNSGVLTSDRATEHGDRRISAADVMKVRHTWRPGKAR